jgi:two-component system chemotaxis response regulator CheY
MVDLDLQNTDEPQVMIIDDMPATRALLRDMLTDMGFTTIEEACDGREALEKLKDQRAQLIVCDHVMKDMSGLDLLSQLRNYPYLVDIPFIVVSAVGDGPIIDAALDLGAADFIVKPVNFSVLKRKISDVLRRNAQKFGVSSSQE